MKKGNQRALLSVRAFNWLQRECWGKFFTNLKSIRDAIDMVENQARHELAWRRLNPHRKQLEFRFLSRASNVSGTRFFIRRNSNNLVYEQSEERFDAALSQSEPVIYHPRVRSYPQLIAPWKTWGEEDGGEWW